MAYALIQLSRFALDRKRMEVREAQAFIETFPSLSLVYPGGSARLPLPLVRPAPYLVVSTNRTVAFLLAAVSRTQNRSSSLMQSP